MFISENHSVKTPFVLIFKVTLNSLAAVLTNNDFHVTSMCFHGNLFKVFAGFARFSKGSQLLLSPLSSAKADQSVLCSLSPGVCPTHSEVLSICLPHPLRGDCVVSLLCLSSLGFLSQCPSVSLFIGHFTSLCVCSFSRRKSKYYTVMRFRF